VSYHWADMMVLWAALEGDYEAVDATLRIYKSEGLKKLVAVCDQIMKMAVRIHLARADRHNTEEGNDTNENN